MVRFGLLFAARRFVYFFAFVRRVRVHGRRRGPCGQGSFCQLLLTDMDVVDHQLLREDRRAIAGARPIPTDDDEEPISKTQLLALVSAGVLVE